MLFAEFDLNQVLIKGRIVGVVGGLVGLFIWIGQKASGNNKRKRDDEDDE